MGNRVTTSACYCEYSFGNLKCKLLNAAENRRAKRACRCLTRRPKFLMFRRKRHKCTCTHQGCIHSVPPIPLGCGPPMKSPCNTPRIDKKIDLTRSGPSPNLKDQRPSTRPIQRSASPKPPACQKPSSPKTSSACQKPSSPKTTTACQKPSTPKPGPKSGISMCQNPKSPTSPTSTCKVQKTSKKVNTDAPKRKIASKTVNTDSPQVARSRSPECKLVRCISTTTSTRSLSPEPEPGPVYICCGGSGQSPDKKNVCRFTVDAYFS